MQSDPERLPLGDAAGAEKLVADLASFTAAEGKASRVVPWKLKKTSSVSVTLARPAALAGTGPPAALETPVSESLVDPHFIPAELRARIRILVVDDDRPLRGGCACVLTEDGYDVTVTTRGDDALDLLKRRRFDIMILDLGTKPVPAPDILRTALQQHPRIVVIATTDQPSVRSSIEIVRDGAWEYLPKPFSATHLSVLVGRASHAIVTARESNDVRLRLLKENGNSEKILLLGVAPAFREAVALARKVARTDASVMIYGESGTGKELIAQFIHHHSRRASKRLVVTNCAALPEPLLESEMFGHRKGAFTGADRDKPGLFEAANGGTFFLDEFTEMSHRLQAKLLRVIQDGVVRRVGSEREDAVVDVRFVSATNRDPQEAVAEGVLREDLFYRLRVVPIKLPPLRQRVEDIPLLANHFLTHYWQQHRQAGTPPPELTDATIEFLQTRPWRGNVRELQNVIEHLTVLAEPGQQVQPENIPLQDTSSEAPAAPVEGGLPARFMTEPYHLAKEKLLAHFQEAYVARLIARSDGNFSKAARLADIDRTTLYRFMGKHSLQRDAVTDH